MILVSATSFFRVGNELMSRKEAKGIKGAMKPVNYIILCRLPSYGGGGGGGARGSCILVM